MYDYDLPKFEFDTNGDGYADTFITQLDLDGDGFAETVISEMDTNTDGYIDLVETTT